jgi:hypothetical protein
LIVVVILWIVVAIGLLVLTTLVLLFAFFRLRIYSGLIVVVPGWLIVVLLLSIVTVVLRIAGLVSWVLQRVFDLQQHQLQELVW